MNGQDSLISEETRRAIARIGNADILVGLPGMSSAGGDLVHAVAAEVAGHFPGVKTVIVNSDGGRPDGTPDTSLLAGHHHDNRQDQLSHHGLIHLEVMTPYHGASGRGSAFREIFLTAHLLKAKACAVIDPEIREMNSEWIDLLIRPVFEEKFDYVAPLYHRRKYDGTITNSIVYPLTRALYGWRIRQPVGGDFGFSGDLATHFLTKSIWDSDIARFGIDIWMTTTALVDGYRVGQAFLGEMRRDAKAPRPELSVILRQVVGSVFSLMEIYETAWENVTATAPVPVLGNELQVALDPIQVNVERMEKAMRQGLKDLLPLWEQVLAAETLDELYGVAGSMGETLCFPDDLWVRVIYDFALGYHYRVLHRDHLISALTPLYLGRTASFILETQESDAAGIEVRIEALCRRFESMKPYLVALWRQG